MNHAILLCLRALRVFVFYFTIPFDSLWDKTQRLKNRFNSLILNNLSMIISALANAAGIYPSVNRFLVHTSSKRCNHKALIIIPPSF